MILFVTLKEHILIFFIKVFFLYHSPRRCHTALANKQKAVGRQLLKVMLHNTPHPLSPQVLYNYLKSDIDKTYYN
jgi:hypothetical protein